LKVNTNISNVIDEVSDKSRYDAEVKKVLSDKTILAWIMRSGIREFEGYSIEEIRECIEGEPAVSNKRVLPGLTPEQITGIGTEDSEPGEGTITYDIRFHAYRPDGKHVKLIINVEAQKCFYPGYDLVTRGVFYCARMISSQCGTEFTPRNYDDLKKVYSIWICMDVPRKMENKITRYRMRKEDVRGTIPDDARYDLLEVVMVCLGRENTGEEGTELLGMLKTLLSEQLQPDEKKEILERKYKIAASVELEGGLQQMCNLSELIEERGMEQGTLNTLVSLVNDGILSEEIAAGRFGVTVTAFRELCDKHWNYKEREI